MFERNKSVMVNLETRETTKHMTNGFPSINKAKRHSHKVQMETNGALGRGAVRLK
jgi:hypothetical protein